MNENFTLHDMENGTIARKSEDTIPPASSRQQFGQKQLRQSWKKLQHKIAPQVERVYPTAPLAPEDSE